MISHVLRTIWQCTDSPAVPHDTRARDPERDDGATYDRPARLVVFPVSTHQRSAAGDQIKRERSELPSRPTAASNVSRQAHDCYRGGGRIPRNNAASRPYLFGRECAQVGCFAARSMSQRVCAPGKDTITLAPMVV
jgi:hypothetical protein